MDNKGQLSEALANKLKEAKSLEELKDIAAQEGYELSEDQLEGVAGGICINDYGCHALTMEPGMMPV